MFRPAFRSALFFAIASLILASACAQTESWKREPTTLLAADGQPKQAPKTSDSHKPSNIAANYRDIANKIIKEARSNHLAFEKLSELADGIGHRFSGSRALDLAINWAADVMRKDGLDNVRLEKVMIPKWVRGKEVARMVVPYERTIPILTLGGSVGTQAYPMGLRAPVMVVHSFEELDARADEVKGKIVLFNKAMPKYHHEHGAGYGATVGYRTQGAIKAAKHGAVATMVRSVTAHSLSTPHTGAMSYEDGTPKIPSIAITLEYAELMARLRASKQKVEVVLSLGAKSEADVPSANVVGEIRGSEFPQEIVVIGGHIDSWDVGQGAHDDGSGCVIMMEALAVLKRLGLRPKRTIRVVLFTNEENGLRGAKAYARDHADEIGKHILAIEADTGGFKPLGYRYKASAGKISTLSEIAGLLGAFSADKMKEGYPGADISPLTKAGVPSLGLWMEGSKYFDYHHTPADTLDKVNPQDLADCVASVAVMAFVAADLPKSPANPAP